MDIKKEFAINTIFEKNRREVESDLEAIYTEIKECVMIQPPERLAQAILQNESPKVNDYIKILRQQLKTEACKVMIECGLTDSIAKIVWANVMNTTGIPKVELCRRQDMIIENNESEKLLIRKEKYKQEKQCLKNSQKLSMGIATIGLTTGIITCLIVPSWTGIAGLVKVASVVVVGTGVAGTVITQKKINEINRIVNQLPHEENIDKDYNDVIAKVCLQQCKTNVNIIKNWIEEVQHEVIKQYEIEIAR